MSTEAARQTVRRYFEDLYNRGEMGVADETCTLEMAAKERDHVAMLRTVFPDLKFTLHDLVADGDKVATRWTFTGTDRGGFAGRPPSGAQVSVNGMKLLRLENGKIAEEWTNMDMLLLIQQIGMIADPWQTPEK